MAWKLLSGFWLLASTQFRVHASPVSNETVEDTGVTPEAKGPFSTFNWFGTSLYGFDECDKISPSIRGWINEAYADANRLVNLPGVKEKIDWNSAAALEYLGPSALNKDQQKQIQAVLANMATVSPGLAPFPNWIRVRCDDPVRACTYKCPTTQDNNEEGQVIAYSRNPNPAQGRRWPDISFCPIWYGMRNLDNAIQYGTGFSNPRQKQDISRYVSRGSAFLHELFHLDLAADSVNGRPNPQIKDLKIRYKDGGKSSGWVEAYGPKHAKILARFLPIGRGTKQTGYFVQRNDDNLVYFSLANYIQSKTGDYPFLPVVTEALQDAPFEPMPKPIDPFVVYRNNGDEPVTLVDFSAKTEELTSHISGPDDCPKASIDENDPYSFEVGKAIPSDMYPEDYLKAKEGWIKTLSPLGGICSLTIREIWTCEDVASNLYAQVSIKDPKGNTLYTTPGSTSSPGQPINDQHPLKITAEGMHDTLTIVGEHTNDYIQFYYGSNVNWTTHDTQGDAKCSLQGDDWGNGPSGCPNAAAAARTFACQYPC
ncbi:hypothetical protein F4803DRAFT_550595 [Xylaria telfairii]|nr:hypothetical protein F4803DRAFT_550595 [Xylaria telfairii]